MQNIIKKITVAACSIMPLMAYAHPGHHHDASFWTGFSHPFTGLDHLVMVLAFGVLMWTASKKWKTLGVIGLLGALVAGFALGAQNVISVGIAEQGIIASLMVVAFALLSKSKYILPLAVMLLASFHGVAHGVELGAGGHVVQQVMGMITAMGIIYAGGLVLGLLIAKYVPHGKKIIATLTALVAIIGLA
jgi:urease accessory protein